MATVFVLQAEHQSVPGSLLEVHATRAGALEAARMALNIMRSDEELPLLAGPLADDAAIDAALDELGAARGEEESDREFDVWIIERDLLSDGETLTESASHVKVSRETVAEG